MKENREYQLKVRLTNSEKEKLVEFAAAHSFTLSDLVRAAIYRFMEVEK